MKIGIVGLGLIGGSIFKDLKELGFDVVAISNSQEGENIFKEYSALSDCDVVFVCSAMNKTLKILDELEEILPAETIVTDVCSLKSFVCKKYRRYKFIPGHPMAGTEHKGFENSLRNLFVNASWILTPFQSTAQSDIDTLQNIIKQLGAKVILTTPEEHDRAAAMISHMPMLLAQAIFKAASKDELALKMASSGFRDMTRLALSNEEMACDMINLNHKNIQTAILKVYKAVGELTCEDYKKQITEIKSQRSEMF